MLPLRYREPELEPSEDEYQKQQYPIGIPVDPKVAGLRYATEIEQRKHVIDSEFLRRNNLLIMIISKTLPLGNIKSKKTAKLLSLITMNMTREKDAGLMDLAEETGLGFLQVIQTSRAQHGFAAKLEVTQRKEWIDKTKPEVKKGLFGRIVRGKEQEEQVEEMMEGD